MQNHTHGRAVKTPNLPFPAASLTMSELLSILQEAFPAFPCFYLWKAFLLFYLVSYVEAYMSGALVRSSKELGT